MQGPPFAVLPEEVEELFAPAFEIEPVDSRAIEEPRFQAQGVSRMAESAYALRRRAA